MKPGVSSTRAIWADTLEVAPAVTLSAVSYAEYSVPRDTKRR